MLDHVKRGTPHAYPELILKEAENGGYVLTEALFDPSRSSEGDLSRPNQE
jgi:hypothetical protein